MGINARLEDAKGNVLAEVPDSWGGLNWLVALGADEGSCLRFVDPYGVTLFNTIQISTLRDELEQLVSRLSDERLSVEKQRYLQEAEHWPPAAKREAAQRAQSVSLERLDEHRQRLLALIERAGQSGPHHYIRFVGD